MKSPNDGYFVFFNELDQNFEGLCTYGKVFFYDFACKFDLVGRLGF